MSDGTTIAARTFELFNMHETIMVAKRTMCSAFRKSNFCDSILKLFMLPLPTKYDCVNILGDIVPIAPAAR